MVEEQQPPVADKTAQGRFAQLRGQFRALVRHFRKRLLLNSVVTLSLLSAVAGLGYLMSTLKLESNSNGEPTVTVDETLAALDAEQWTQARELAADLRLVNDLNPDERGVAAFVLGKVMYQDAAVEWKPRERKALYLLAARYLEESRAEGLPPGREKDGLTLLGTSLYEMERYPESLPVLKLVTDTDPTDPELFRLLAEAYLRVDPPDLDQAIEANRRYLNAASLPAEARANGVITLAEILFKQGKFDESQTQLEMVPPGSRKYPDALLLLGRLELARADVLLHAGQNAESDSWQESQDLLEAAEKHFEQAKRDNPGSSIIARQARYLLGRTARKLDDFELALEHFSRTRRLSFDTHEGLASGVEEADMLRALDRGAEATEAYRRVFRQAADLKHYANPWITRRELGARGKLAFRTYFDQGEFDLAIELAGVMAAFLSREEAVRLQAEAQVAQAQRQDQDPVQGRLGLSRASWRKAGALYEQLAKIRFATRRYAETLGEAARCYLQGQDYQRASRLLRAQLQHEVRRRHPPVLTSLGEAELALDKPRQALKHLMEVVEFYPRDPHSYRARLIAAKALVETGDYSAAEDLLLYNLEHEALTPRSVEWRQSLYDLGKIYYREGLAIQQEALAEESQQLSSLAPTSNSKKWEQANAQFEKAVQTLTEAVERDKLASRDPFALDAILAHYCIAESHRQSAKLPIRKLESVSIGTTISKLQGEIHAHLTAATEEYEALQQTLREKDDVVELSPTEQRILRNSYFAVADALFDMGRFERAIEAYSTVTNSYQHEPAALEAYVQIASCQRQLNRHEEAQGTLEQAKVILSRIRKDADFLRTTRYDQEEWEEILQWLASM